MSGSIIHFAEIFIIFYQHSDSSHKLSYIFFSFRIKFKMIELILVDFRYPEKKKRQQATFQSFVLPNDIIKNGHCWSKIKLNFLCDFDQHICKNNRSC